MNISSVARPSFYGLIFVNYWPLQTECPQNADLLTGLQDRITSLRRLNGNSAIPALEKAESEAEAKFTRAKEIAKDTETQVWKSPPIFFGSIF